jgi:hypothetical protein
MNQYIYNQWQLGNFFEVAHLAAGKSMGEGAVSFVKKKQLWPKAPMGLPPLWLAFGFLKAKAARKSPTKHISTVLLGMCLTRRRHKGAMEPG